ncbi:MAG: pyridoxamine 5'-phosphate oxidase [Alphaproteobacteria bacterium]
MQQSPMHAPDFLSAAEPFGLLARWYAEAQASEPRDHNACQLATVDAAGLPNVRTVLLKDAGREGFVFFTNTESAKGEELKSGKAAILLYWKTLSRQIRVRGAVLQVSAREADDYFATRPREAQIGAWASMQSRELPDRAEFERRITEFGKRFANASVPRPPHWCGFRLSPEYIEFWQERPFRWHDRLAFAREAVGWRRFQLYP